MFQRLQHGNANALSMNYGDISHNTNELMTFHLSLEDK